MNDQKLITTRQLIMTLLLSMMTLKVLLLPNLMAVDFGRDSYIFLAVMLLNDFGILLIFLYMQKKFPGKNFYEIMNFLFGEFIAKIIFVLLALFFFAKCCGVFQSTYVYLNENLYTTYNWFVFSLPFLIVLVFCLMRGLFSLGRLLECTFPVMFIGVIVASSVGVMRADFTNLLPFFENGFSKASMLINFSYWFGDYLIIILFFGRIKFEKKYGFKIILSILLGILLIVCFYVIVYARFGYNTITHTNGISDVLQVQPSSSDIGSIDWILILVWDISLFVNFLLNAYGVTFCMKTLIPKMSQLATSIVVASAVFAVNYFCQFNIYLFVELAQKYMCYYSAVIQGVLPNIFAVFTFFKCKKRDKMLPLPKNVVKEGNGG